MGLSGKRVHVHAYTYTRARTRVHGKRVHGKRVHGKRVHGKRVHGKRVHGKRVHGKRVHGKRVHGKRVHGKRVHGKRVHGKRVHGKRVHGKRVHGKRVHGKRVHGKRVHGKRVHGKRVQCSFVTLIKTWRFYWKSSCRPSDCVNDGQIMASVKDNFTVDYVMFSTFIVLEHASRKSSRISNHLTLLSHALEIMPLLRDEHWRYINHTFGNLAIQ